MSSAAAALVATVVLVCASLSAKAFVLDQQQDQNQLGEFVAAGPSENRGKKLGKTAKKN
jgi:hypothetical protein